MRMVVWSGGDSVENESSVVFLKNAKWLALKQ